MNNKSNGDFSYTYSAKEQDEIRRIREKYTVREQEEDKMTRLRRLDAKATQKAQTVSLCFGVIGTLILGFGMSLFMSDLSKILGAYENMAMLLGILVGVVGGILASLAYPIYNLTVKRERKRIAPEILRLSDELMK